MINLHERADPATLTISRDGTTVSTAELGVAIPVDPGRHEVSVTAPGKDKWRTSIDVGEGGQTENVEVPLLADSSGGGESGGPVTDEPSDGSTQRVLGVVVGGVGLVGVGLGTFFGLSASSNWSDAKKECTDNVCTAKGVASRNDAAGQATISTVAFVVGGVGLAAGAALYFTAASGKETTVAIGFGPGNVSIQGSF